jgi:cell wall-associated NlpC family hydrolase
VTLEDLKYEHLQAIPFTEIGDRDCYELCRDFFRENFKIELTPYVRPHDWESDSLDLIRMFHDNEGFDSITDWRPKDLRPGDVLAMSINESNPNHLAIYVGDDKILHHLYGRMSRIEPLHGFWRNHTSFILRHKDVPDLRPVYPDVDYMELLRARNTPPAE